MTPPIRAAVSGPESCDSLLLPSSDESEPWSSPSSLVGPDVLADSVEEESAAGTVVGTTDGTAVVSTISADVVLAVAAEVVLEGLTGLCD